MKQILFVGDAARGAALAELSAAHGWHTHIPMDMMAALGMHIFYVPTVIVIEDAGQAGFGAETYTHLASLDDGTPIILTGTTPDGNYASTDPAVVFASVQAIVTKQPVTA